MSERRRVYVSNNSLSAVVECSTRVAVQYGQELSFETEKDAANVGTVVHTVLHQYVLGLSRAECAALLRAEYERLGLLGRIEVTDRLGYPNVAECLEAWFDQNPWETLPYRIRLEHAEVKFAVPLCEVQGANGTVWEVWFRGVMDGLGVMKGDGSWRVIDNKTTGFLGPEKSRLYAMGSQFSGYVWAARELGYPVSGVIAQVIVLPWLPGSDTAGSSRSCKKHGVKYRECRRLHAEHRRVEVLRTEGQLELWKQDAVRLARRYVRVLEVYGTEETMRLAPQEGLFLGMACQYCDLQEYCYYGRPEDAVGRLLVRTPRAAWGMEELLQRYGGVVG